MSRAEVRDLAAKTRARAEAALERLRRTGTITEDMLGPLCISQHDWKRYLYMSSSMRECMVMSYVANMDRLLGEADQRLADATDLLQLEDSGEP